MPAYVQRNPTVDEKILSDRRQGLKDRSSIGYSLKFITGLILFLLVSACGSLGTVRGSVNDPQFQAENYPIRDLKLAILSDGRHSEQEIRNSVCKASSYLGEQVGITLSISHFDTIQFSGSTITEMLNNVFRKVTGYDDDSFDIAVGYAGYTAADYAAQALSFFVPVPFWLGVIDDQAGKVVVVKTTDETVLMHELMHSFIFDYVHSETGLMADARINLLPFLPSLNRSHYISMTDREQVLKNKWREIKFSNIIQTKIPACEKDYIYGRPEHCGK
jgi:hypothetical protein